MSKWIEGTKLLIRWNIRDSELFEYVKRGLQPHDPRTSRPIPPPNIQASQSALKMLKSKLTIRKHSRAMLGRKPISQPLAAPAYETYQVAKQEKSEEEQRAYLDKDIEAIEKRIDSLTEEQSAVKDDSWRDYNLSDSEAEIDRDFEQLVGALYLKLEVRNFLGQERTAEVIRVESRNEKKLRPSQRHKLQARAVAKELWQAHPTMTIQDMIWRDEISKAFGKKVYAEKTLRNWINDLCPDRSKGRRPKKT